MRDPKHGKEVPVGRDIALMLRRWFAFIGRRAAAQLLAGHRVSLHRFIEPMAQSLLPIIEAYYRGGANRARREILIALAKKRTPKKVLAGIGAKAFRGPHFRVKRGDQVSQLLAGFDVLVPQVQTAIMHHVYQFVQETLNTATMDAEESYMETRRQIAAGLEQGDTQREMSKRIVEIFEEPRRAFEISTYETSFAIHEGGMIQARSSGLKMEKKWLTDAAACDKCLALEAKGFIPLDEPYATNASKNPRYAVIMHPGLHPHCGCTQELQVE